METIKSYTDLEQSKKLAKILPIESADMYWDLISRDNYAKVNNIGYCLGRYCVYAWSLAALLDVLPNNENIITNLSKGGYRISTLEYTNSWFVDYEDETDSLNNCVISADNPVDACYEMILKLHELKML